MTFSIAVITIARKWNVISFSKVLKSNLTLYATLVFIYIISFLLNIYILNFSRKNDLIEKITYLLFFIILLRIQAFFFLEYFYKNTKNTFFKIYKVLILSFYSLSLVYILINYFPDNAYDKFLTHSKTYNYQPVNYSKILLDSSTLKIDSAISIINYYSDKETIEKDLDFTIYFNSRHKENIPFAFKALDSTNEFGGSSSQIKYKQLYLKKLNDTIKIILREYSNKSLSSDGLVNTDTIIFIKTKTTITRYP
jgi:hypothetical protein